MKIKILGSGAYERIPSMFCNCEVCNLSRKKGGKYIRTQSSTIIDEDLLIDFGEDNYLHFLNNGLNFNKVKGVLITHTHSDHFYGPDLKMLGSFFAKNTTNEINFLGSYATEELFNGVKGRNNCTFNKLTEYQPFVFGEYTIIPIPANHSTTSAFCYIIKKGEKTLFYSQDTAILKEEVYQNLAKLNVKINCVIADCTCCLWQKEYCGEHMSLLDNVIHKNKLLELGLLAKGCKWVINHFSHNAMFKPNGEPATIEELENKAKEYNMEVAFDGFTIEI